MNERSRPSARGKQRPAHGWTASLLPPAMSSRAALRRGMLSLIAIGGPIIVGILRGESTPGLVGGITGLLLTLADTEGELWRRLGMTVVVALGIAIGGALGAWLATVHPLFWLVFFASIFVAGLLNLLGKGPHFAVRFGAISFAVISSLPNLAIKMEWYWAGAVALTLLAKFVDERLNGPLPPGPPWPGSISAARSHWLRFALAYAIAATAGLWIGVQSGSVRAVWISAIVLVIMLPDLRVTYARIFEGIAGTVLAVLTVFLLSSCLLLPGTLRPGWPASSWCSLSSCRPSSHASGCSAA